MTPRDVEKTLGERRRDAIRLGEGRLRRRTTSKPFVDRGVVVTDRRGVARSIYDRFGDAEESAEGNANLLLVPAAESVVVVEHDVAEFLVRLDVGDHPRSRGAVLPEHAHARADGRSERRGGDASVVRRTGVGVGRAPIYDAGHAPILRPAGYRARAGRDGAEQPRARLDVFRGGGGVVARVESRVPALARVRRGGLRVIVGTRVHDGTEASEGNPVLLRAILPNHARGRRARIVVAHVRHHPLASVVPGGGWGVPKARPHRTGAGRGHGIAVGGNRLGGGLHGTHARTHGRRPRGRHRADGIVDRADASATPRDAARRVL